MSETTQTTAVAEIKKDISAQVLAKIDSFQKSGELKLPKDYSVENALKSAYLILSESKVLEKCTKASIADSLLKMAVYAVSPLKKQCYFIPYGNQLTCQISYAGNISAAKRYGGLKSIKGNAIFEDDVFKFEVDSITGRKKVIEHTQTLESISKSLKGAYAVYELNDGSIDVEIMNMDQIRQAWKQGATKGESPAHKNFPDQMAIKTVINRACKLLINSSDDSVLYFDDEFSDVINDSVSNNVDAEIIENANTETIDFKELANEEPQPVQQERVVTNNSDGQLEIPASDY